MISHVEKINNRCDSLAKTGLVEGLIHRDFISNDFPYETVRIMAGSKKLSGPLRPFIKSHYGKQVAKQVFGHGKRGKKLLSDEDFDWVMWELISRALKKKYPSSFSDWLSKHVTGCCGVNRFLSKWQPGTENRCPCCNGHNEDIYHLTTYALTLAALLSSTTMLTSSNAGWTQTTPLKSSPRTSASIYVGEVASSWRI